MKTLLIFTALLSQAFAGEQEANYLSDRVQNYHMLYGLVHETQFTSPTSEEILWTNGYGDAAIWTGTYLAAESFRYAVTRSPTSLAYVKRTLNSVKNLSEVSGTGLLARAYFPIDAPYADRYKEIEGGYGLYEVELEGRRVWWQAHPTRDQYSGVFFGLAMAYDLVDDQEVRDTCAAVITRLADYLLDKNWMIRHPDTNKIQETFVTMVHQQLAILQIAKHVNPARFAKKYSNHRKLWGWWMKLRFLKNSNLHGSYFAFNLNYTYLYNLLRLEKDPKVLKGYLKSYTKFRKHTANQNNAWFNMVDFALRGPDATRDAETVQWIDQLWQRGFRDYYTDASTKYPVCDGRACEPLPVIDRPYADFIWQRSPYQLAGGGDGSAESPGVDYILAYWMARYYGVISN